MELWGWMDGWTYLLCLSDAVAKLEEALRINPRKHDALWCLGNARTSQGFLVTDTDKANAYFKKAARCFQHALDEEPNNELYRKALEMTEKAPSLHQELQKQLASQQVILGSGPTVATGNAAKRPKKKDNDFKYDVLGWIVLAVGVIAWMGMTKSSMPPPPPPPSSLR
jgi:tetratricopeptide (TPR) repeat protein